MKKRSYFSALFFVILSSAGVSSSFGSLIYDAAFTATEIGFTHTTSSPPVAGPQSVSGPNYSFGYAVAPQTDTTSNFMITSGGQFSTRDFGGEAFLRSSSIDVSGLSLVDITGNGVTVGTAVFNSTEEDFNWFYSLDGGIDVAFGLTSSDGSLDAIFSSLDVTGSSALTVGFRYNINGAGDGFDVTSLNVSAVPEPKFVAPFVLAIFSLLLIRLKAARKSDCPEV